MSESLGLSVGAANLVAVRAGHAPLRRSSVLTLFEHRPTEVGLPEENPNLTESGLVLRGFVERVGDPSPLVAADGTKYLGEVLTVEAIEAMARAVGYGTPVTIAVPSYWSQAQFSALREEFFAQPDLERDGVPPTLVSDATAALAGLRTQPGFPTDGAVAVCDFGAGGTSVTLMGARPGSGPTGSTLRHTEFSGDAIDQLVAEHVRAPAADATVADLGATTRIGSQTRLLGECRRAKERLSTAATATVTPGSGEPVVLSRNDFEQLIAEPLEHLLRAIDEALQRNGIGPGGLAAVAAVGGGAAIPLVGARLSQRFGVPLLTAAQPGSAAAVGAALLGQQQASAGVPTSAAAAVQTPTELVPTARAADADPALAWSQDADDADDELVPYTGRDATGEYAREATEYDDDRDAPPAAGGGLPWYKRTALVVSVAAAGAAVLVAVLLGINLADSGSNPGNPPATEPAPPPTSQTVTVTGPGDSTTVTVLPPPPTTQPPATTTAAPPQTTTTTTATTTAAPTTTTQPSTTTEATTTAAPPAPTRDRPFPRFEPPFRR
ncbi:Hsp70 family protein [Mycobacterium parmense]|nr:Hsp70 family protein [Mycobacterium parmense]MCV7350428.1 Hsp70 family protein [Mycobacterium parmense]ORW48162.1 molecular chaperone [Mycobacterium parmense]